jgi:hypothetical protein
MRFTVLLLSAACVIAMALPSSRADDSAGVADPIRVHLDNAKAVNTKAKQQAIDVLRTACEKAINSAVGGKQSDQAALLKSQEQAFNIAGTLPSSPALKQAVDDYREAITLADANLDRAYSRAVRHYAAQNESEKALAVEQEKSRLHHQHAPAIDPPARQDTTSPEAIAQTLQQAKAKYRIDVNEATKTLTGKIDARLNAVMNAGQFQPAKNLQAIAAALKNDGQIPDHATDPEVITAVAGYRHAIQSANIRMARAYSLAVSNLTRARQLDRADTLQKEFITAELSDIDLNAVSDDGAGPPDTTYVLGRNLPEFLTTAEHWDMHPRGGIFLQRRAYIRSKNGDFLNRDFTCDLWFTTETTGTSIFIGLGEGRGRPADELPFNSLALCIASPDANEGAVGFLRPDGQIDTIGHLTTAGDYVARIERAGNILSMSIGDEDADGTFNARFSTTISDTTVLAPFMTTHNAHIFFGGGRFWKIRYINGKPPAIIPDVVVKSIMRG